MHYNYFKDRRSLLRTLLLVGIASAVIAVLPIVNVCLLTNYNEALLGDALGLVYILSAWMYGNHVYHKYCKESGQYGNKLPLKLRLQVMRVRYPLIAAGLISIIIAETVRLAFAIA